jgi:hypothetical protein
VFIVVAYGSVVMALHRGVAARVVALTNRRAIQMLAHGVPGTLMLVMLSPFLRSFEWRLLSSELVQNWRDALVTAAGLYTGASAIVWGVLWLVSRLTKRRSDRALTPP